MVVKCGKMINCLNTCALIKCRSFSGKKKQAAPPELPVYQIYALNKKG